MPELRREKRKFKCEREINMCEDIGRMERKHKPQEEKRKLNRQRKNAYSNCKLPRNEQSPSLLMQKQESERLPPPLYVPCS